MNYIINIINYTLFQYLTHLIESNQFHESKIQ